MTPRSPAVACSACARTWNSETMVEGLRMLGTCPRCGGELRFAADEADAAPAEAAPSWEREAVAPHMVLGIPRR